MEKYSPEITLVSNGVDRAAKLMKQNETLPDLGSKGIKLIEFFKMLMDYKKALREIEADETIWLTRLSMEYRQEILRLEQIIKERNEVLSQAKDLIKAGIETENTDFLSLGSDMLKALLSSKI